MKKKPDDKCQREAAIRQMYQMQGMFEKNPLKFGVGPTMWRGGGSEPRPGYRRGRCKWFNVAKGWGFITPDEVGSTEVFVHQSVIVKTGFRSLGEGEIVEFQSKISEKGIEATKVTGVNGQQCQGSDRRPMSRRKFKKIRCYNCGEFANHIASKCPLDPQPKRCHHCKSTDHLIAECPQRNLQSMSRYVHNGNTGRPIGVSYNGNMSGPAGGL